MMEEILSAAVAAAAAAAARVRNIGRIIRFVYVSVFITTAAAATYIAMCKYIHLPARRAPSGGGVRFRASMAFPFSQK